MRSTRSLLLLAIILILGGVAVSYLRETRNQARQAPERPQPLPLGVDAAARDWQWSRNIGSRPGVEVRATNFKQIQDPERTELDGVELRLYHEDGREYDLVKSARAIFDPVQGTLYADGDVEIVMGVREQPASGRVVLVRTSGVTFDSKTGRASTERLAEFTFEQGEGKATGASYDPSAGELHMRGGVELNWRGPGGQSQPLRLEAGEALYKETDSLIQLFPWSRLVRGLGVIEAGESEVRLSNGLIHTVEAKQARGVNRTPERPLEYAAEQLWVSYAPTGQIEKLTGERNAQLVSHSNTARTTILANRVDLEFEPGEEESTLKRAVAAGAGRLESVPLAQPGSPARETRVLHSEVIVANMRPGGKEIDRLETGAPGRLEFIPNGPGQRRRVVEGERMLMTYGAGNLMRSYRATKVFTRSDPAASAGAARPPLETSSKEMTAEFDPTTGRIIRIEQSGEFRYREGTLEARSRSAVLDDTANEITLENAARAWDPSGSTSADRIVLDRVTGEIRAHGNVSSSRVAESGSGGGSPSIFSADQPILARAQSMTSTGGNRVIRYEGSVILWQGVNRIQASRIEIDRQEGRLTASGSVFTQFVDQQNTLAQTNGSFSSGEKPPPFIVIRSQNLVYNERNKTAEYTQSARLVRTGMDVQADSIRVQFSEAGAPSSLDRAYANGAVTIVHKYPGFSRTGKGDYAEYRAGEERVVLKGKDATLLDSLRGSTRGRELTYYAADDRLLVYGGDDNPVKSRLRRK